MAQRLTDAFRLAIAQLNPVVGDLAGNLALARAARAEAAAGGADIVLFTELFLSGYPPEDLVLRPAFLDACRATLSAFAADTADGGPAVLVGVPWRDEGGVRNAMALLDDGRVETLRYKVELPNYGVFDEKRVFAAGPLPEPFTVRGLPLGVPICEDLWTPALCDHLVRAGATMLLVPNGSPYWRGKMVERHAVVAARVAETGVPVVYANMVGGQDELVFDGGSFALHGDRSDAFRLPQFTAETAFVDWKRDGGGWRVVSGPHAAAPADDEADWRASVLGLRDYVGKNRFPGVVLGLSGGVDSAVVAAIATDALGPDRVRCVMLPYRFTSSQSLRDAEACARVLGVRYDVVPIAGPVEAAEAALQPLFGDRARDVAEENLQARTRGILLMGISNKLGPLLLSTGNKSEVSVGYATLYGDMNGGFNPIKDLYKTDVYRLARWRNANRPDGLLGPPGEVIPEAIIVRAPSAELRENQTDQDSLPPYDILDAILLDLIENERSVAEIVAKGHDAATVRRVEHMVAISEYKRRQAAPGVKISGRNFGRDRRYPITNRFREEG
ncbi:MAG: NAD+ synthase [Bauldia sp.]|nr:NAD+ synthase [Bauldia sp.]